MIQMPIILTYEYCFIMPSFIIGVAGPSGSGKSSITQELIKHYGADQCTVISSDNYYKGLGSTSLERRHEFNFDHPDSIEFALLEQHLRTLKSGKPVEIPTYDFATSTRKPEKHLVVPTKIIIVEGILVLHPQELSRLFDFKIYVDADSDLCLARRLRRDTAQRGRTVESVLEQYLSTVKPMYEEFVRPSQDTADLVIENSNQALAITTELQFDINPIIKHLEAIEAGKKTEKCRYRLFPSIAAAPSQQQAMLPLAGSDAGRYMAPQALI